MEPLRNTDAMYIIDEIEDIIMTMEDKLNMVLTAESLDKSPSTNTLVPAGSALVNRLKFVRDKAVRLKNRIEV